MSPEELALRMRRQLRLGGERLGLVAYEVPSPTWPPAHDARLPVPRNLTSGGAIVRAADDVLAGRFELFGRRYETGFPPRWNADPLTGTVAPLTFGKTLDYRDVRVVGDAKHLWELNRHLELVWLAQAYRMTEDHAYLAGLRRLVESWVAQCPYLKGPNWCSSLELGIRLINWHLAYEIAGGAQSPLFAGRDGERFRTVWLDSIYRHLHFIMHHLSTHPSSANNHLIGELAGVFTACCSWPCWPITEKWRAETRAALQREILRQTHADGVNREQTTWYQQFVASLFLVAGIAGRRNGQDFEPLYWRSIERMLDFLFAIMDRGGNMPMIGDADDGLAFALEPRAVLDPFRAVLAIGSRLYGVAEWRSSAAAAASAEWICAGIEPIEARRAHAASASGAAACAASRGRRIFRDGGYYLLGRSFGQHDEVRVIVDAGPLGFLSIAGHGHADCLAIVLSVAGREQLIDPGTYIYHSNPSWRDYFRGTAAHNTVRVDRTNQSEIGGPFLWLAKAVPRVERVELGPDVDILAASHDGYARLRDPVRHMREVTFDKRADVLEVVDHLACRGPHSIERLWHFAEHCEVSPEGTGLVSVDGAVRLRFETDDEDAQIELLRGSIDPVGGWVSRGFGRKVPTTTAVYRNRIEGDAVMRTRIKVERL